MVCAAYVHQRLIPVVLAASGGTGVAVGAGVGVGGVQFGAVPYHPDGHGVAVGTGVGDGVMIGFIVGVGLGAGVTPQMIVRTIFARPKLGQIIDG